MCAPAIRSLRTRFPQATLDFLVASEFADAARLIPGIDNIIEFDKRDGWRGILKLRRLFFRKYDLICDFQNSPRSAFLRTFAFPMMWTKAKRYRLRRWLLIRFKLNLYRASVPVPLRYLNSLAVLGAVDDQRGLGLRVPEAQKKDSTTNTIMLCPGSKHATKRWPIEHWSELARALQFAGFEIVVCGTQDEAALCRAIAPSARQLISAGLSEIAQEMQSAAAVVCNDSGLMHLATGVGARVIALFGPTVEQFGFFPFRGQSEVIQTDLNCRPCSAFGGSKCPLGHHNCMNHLTPEAVKAATLEFSQRQ